MPTLSQTDLRLLSAIASAGGAIHVVTHRARVPDHDAIGLCAWANSMCDQDYMRLERINGDKNHPAGERSVDYALTMKAERAVERLR